MKHSTLLTLALALLQGCFLGDLFGDDQDDAGAPIDAGAAADVGPRDLAGDSEQPPPEADAETARPGLELQIDFDELANGRLVDGSGNGRGGTLAAGARLSPDGKRGSALELTGTLNQAVDLGAILDELPQLTVEVWVKASTTSPGWDAVVSNFGVSDGYWLGSGLGANGVAEWRVRSNAVYSNSRPFDGQWNHLAASYDTTTEPATLVLYVNGVEEARSALAGQQAPAAPDFNLLLGAGGVGRRPFVGLLDELKIWSVVRGAAQICADAGGRYSAGFEPECLNL